MNKKELLEVKLPKLMTERDTLVTRVKGNGLIVGIYHMHELILRLWLGKKAFLCVKEYNGKPTRRIVSDVLWRWDARDAGFSVSYSDFMKNLVIPEKERAAILKFTGRTYDERRKLDQFIGYLDRYEERIKALERLKRIDVEGKRVRLATREPRGFAAWLEKQEVMFLIQGRRGKLSATCSHCQGRWDTDMKGEESGECPYCGAFGTYKKHDIRSRKVFEYSGSFLGRNQEGEIVEVIKNCHVTYDGSYLNRSVNIHPGDRRIIPSKGSEPVYAYCGNGRYKRSYRVFNVRGYMYTRYQKYAHMYPYNVKKLLKGTPLERYECDKYAFAHQGMTSFFGDFIAAIQAAPIAEQVMKGGFREMIYHMYMYNQAGIVNDYMKAFICNKELPKGQPLAGAMGLTGTQFKRLRGISCPNVEVALTAFMNRTIPEISPYVVDSYASLYSLPEARSYYGVPIGPALKNRHMLSAAFADYLNKVEDSEKIKFLKDYEDYYGWISEMGYPLNKSNLRPKDFRKKHDEMQVLYAEYREAKKQELLKKESEYMSQIKPIVEALFKIPLSDDEYEIIVPSCREDLIQESERLHHCVRNYSKQIYNHSCVIVFIRKKSSIDTPFYTMEINKNCNIQQCRTVRNESYERHEDMRKTIVSYEKAVKENVRKEECAELLKQLEFQVAA